MRRILAAPSRNLLLAALLSSLVLVCAAGCASHEMPAPLSPEEKATVERSRLGLIVGFERRSSPDSLAIEALRRTRIFKTVDYVEQLKAPPDVLVHGIAIVDGSAVVPILTIGSLGFFPTRTYERWGYWYSFRSARSMDETMEVEFSHRSATVLGWTCLRLNKTPDWSSDSPNENERMYDRLALAIALKAAAIKDLSAKSGRRLNVRKIKSGSIVLAAADTKTDCALVPWDTTYPKTYVKVFGPAPDAACKKWIAENCRSTR